MRFLLDTQILLWIFGELLKLLKIKKIVYVLVRPAFGKQLLK